MKPFTLLNRDEDNIDKAYLIDNGGGFDTQAVLRANDPTWFLVRLELSVEAEGDGSYAEVNFSDGVANFIRPLVLFAWPA